MRFFCLASLGCFIALAALQVRATEIVVSADATVKSTAPAEKYGGEPQLTVDPTSTSYLQFDLGSLPAGTTASMVANASLVLYVDKVVRVGTVAFNPACVPWQESTITASRAPPTCFGGEGMFTVPAVPNQFVTVKDTALVKNWPAPTPANKAVILTSQKVTAVDFESKENTGTSQPARLVI